ncbi:MAG: ABC transporter permease [Muribaculum sp.]|nr:ABC transporter permease [Muribaculum sp.]
MANVLGLIIEREYFERVRRKSFIVTTILVPILMIGLMLAPALIMAFGDSGEKTVAVVDNTGTIAPRLKGNDDIKFQVTTTSVDSLRADEDNELILVIDRNAVKDPQHGILLLTRGSLPMMTDAYITEQLKQAIEDQRLEQYDIPNIREIMDSVTANVQMATVRIDNDRDTQTSSTVSYFLALIMDMMLYMFILIYGQMVMTSIIEEKTNRVLELVVSSVRPFQLMLGKIAGVGLTALTQILIWASIIGVAVAVSGPMLTSDSLSSEMDVDMVAAVTTLFDPSFLLQLLMFTLLFFIGGFMFYSSIFAAIGSSVSNVQDAGQLSSIATMPIIIGIMASMFILNDPDSTLAFWLCMIPFTSPMSMMARMPYGVPVWESILSLVILYASFIFMIWLCGKIYRVGIFMYGKKPSFAEIIRWARYK